MATEIVIASACRTAIGKFGGSLKNIPAVDLGATVIKEAVNRAGLKPEQVNEVIFGNVITAGLGQNPARQASIKAGLPVECTAMTINIVCGSGLKAVALAANQIKAGEADIIATANDGGLQAVCHVTVDIVRPKSVTLDVTEKNLYRGDTFTLAATVLPTEAVNKAVTWRSSDATVASVDENGKVTALAEGQTTITVTTVDGGLTATCDVKVEICRPESVSLNYTTFAMSKGGTLQLVATVSPEKAENKSVTWSTSDQAKASVSETGLVTALAPGEVTITVTTVDGGKTATCVVTIQDSGDFTGGNEGYGEEDLN